MFCFLPPLLQLVSTVSFFSTQKFSQVVEEHALYPEPLGFWDSALLTLIATGNEQRLRQAAVSLLETLDADRRTEGRWSQEVRDQRDCAMRNLRWCGMYQSADLVGCFLKVIEVHVFKLISWKSWSKLHWFNFGLRIDFIEGECFRQPSHEYAEPHGTNEPWIQNRLALVGFGAAWEELDEVHNLEIGIFWNYFEVDDIQLVVSWCFGLVVWISGIPLLKGIGIFWSYIEVDSTSWWKKHYRQN